MPDADPINLLCIVGRSPAVVTETLYGLCVDEATDRPLRSVGHLHVVTTEYGRTSPQGGLRDLLRRKVEEMGREFGPEVNERLPTIDNIEEPVVPTYKYSTDPIRDVRTSEASARLGDTILELIRELAGDEQPPLHASIAGGRKTMGYFVGVVMTLFGRFQDRISHVLLGGEDETGRQLGRLAESADAFFYPPGESQMISARDDDRFDASQVEVELYEVPFVPLEMSAGDAPDRVGRSVEKWVGAAVERIRGEDAILTVDLDRGGLTFAGEKIHFHSYPDHALYLLVAIEQARGNAPLGPGEIASDYQSHLAEILEHILRRDPREYAATDPTRKPAKIQSNLSTAKAGVNRQIERSMPVNFRPLLRIEDGNYRLGLEDDQIEIRGDRTNYPAFVEDD